MTECITCNGGGPFRPEGCAEWCEEVRELNHRMPPHGDSRRVHRWAPLPPEVYERVRKSA